jgi:hypothetical protein
MTLSMTPMPPARLLREALPPPAAPEPGPVWLLMVELPVVVQIAVVAASA